MSDTPAHENFPADFSTRTRHALVFGATGFIGRWLVKELLDQHIPTIAAVRSAASAGQLSSWLANHHSPTDLLRIVQVDLDIEQLGGPPAELKPVTEVFNVAGAYRFGMTAEEAAPQTSTLPAESPKSRPLCLPSNGSSTSPAAASAGRIRHQHHGRPNASSRTTSGSENANPETLSFLSSDRYPTEQATTLAVAHGLHHPDTRTALERWSEHLTVRRP